MQKQKGKKKMSEWDSNHHPVSLLTKESSTSFYPLGHKLLAFSLRIMQVQ